MHKNAVKGRAVIQGIFKAPTIDNQDRTPGIDCKFKFLADGTFKFFQKSRAGKIVTNGTYEMEAGLIDLKPAPKDANWPVFWTTPAEVAHRSDCRCWFPFVWCRVGATEKYCSSRIC